MSVTPRIDTPEALRSFVEARVPLKLLGMLLRGALDAFQDAFTIFYARSPSGMGVNYDPFHPETAINTIPGLVRSRLESRFPAIADAFAEAGINWTVGTNTSRNHRHYEIHIGDDLKIVVTKYNNGTQEINLNKKKLAIAVMNEMDTLFPELTEVEEEQQNKHTLYVAYGYKQKLFECFEFDTELLEHIDLAYSGIDPVDGKVRSVTLSLMDYVMHMPEESVNITIIPRADNEEDIEVTPNKETEEHLRRKRENEE